MNMKPIISPIQLLAAGLLLLAADAVSAADAARKIAPNDVLHIAVLTEPEMTAEPKVKADGTIDYFFIGTLKVAGSSASEVQTQLREMLDKDYLVNPQVSVEVKLYDTQYVTVTGQVARPGRVEIPPDHRIDVIEAIGSAGDFTRIGNRRDIKVRSDRTGQTVKYSYDQLQKLSEAGTRVMVETGDVVTVGETIL